MFRASLEPFGLTDVNTYIAAAVFWTVGNSVLEEYVFRWFLVEKGEVLFGSEWRTIFASAGLFVLHHFFALHFLGFSLAANLLSLALGCSSAGGIQLALRKVPKHLDSLHCSRNV